jgi:hypothetical protein
LALGTVVGNLLVIVLLWLSHKSGQMNVFDKVIIGHAFVDGLTGIISMPIFHVTSLFGYWPLTDIIAKVFATYDNNINTTTSLHMLYMSYIRLRSIQSPKHYLNEKLIKRPILMMVSFWAISLTIWIIIVSVFELDEFSLSVAFDRNTQYISLFINFIGWFMPLMLIFYFSVETMIFLRKRSRRITNLRRVNIPENASITVITKRVITSKKTTVTSPNEKTKTNKIKRMKNFFYFKPQTVFLIIISTYWMQWTPPCILTIIQTFCDSCINSIVFGDIYWLTYTVKFNL